jgi:serine/threonine protein phosphatase PrpC
MSPADAFEASAATHVGCVRVQNEDSYLSRSEIGLWAVADGMGGHEAGDVASAAVVDALARIVPQERPAALYSACEAQIQSANRDIRAIAAARGGATMGSTIVAFLAFGRHYACLWAGDSRAYLLRRGERLRQITRDHTEAEQLLVEGLLSEEEARNWPRRNVITRAVGAADDLAIDLAEGEIAPGDVFVLCSDGLTTHVEPHEIAECIARRSAEGACAELIALALERGGTDNVTVIVLRWRGEPETTQWRPASDGRSGTRPR